MNRKDSFLDEQNNLNSQSYNISKATRNEIRFMGTYAPLVKKIDSIVKILN